jgi:glutamate synthase (NADPH) small chain
MTDPRGFLQIARRVAPYRPVAERLGDSREVSDLVDPALARGQAQRCMDCGVPFCHEGCPLGNLIPDWNDLVHRDRWRSAIERLHATNNFPEFTGKLCPAPCEEACVLAVNDDAVTIKQVEMAIVERAFDEGWVVPRPPTRETGRRVAVVGSGPAGLAAAQQLRRAGHAVTVLERDDAPGGLLRYGIPDFKIGKHQVERRLRQLEAEGVRFEVGADVGRGTTLAELRAQVDAVVLATGAQRHRDLPLPGRDLAGIEYAMPYLTGRNRALAGVGGGAAISAAGRRVIVIGGGDTSADCLGCAHREGAASVAELAHGPQPPEARTPQATWPEWPFLLRTYAAHGEGGERVFAFETVAFEGEAGRLTGLRGRRVEFPDADGVRKPPPGSSRQVGPAEVLPADLVLLAIGFTGVESDDPVYAGVDLVEGRTVAVDGHATSLAGVFAAGDCVLGADLVVTAIAEGREAARAVDRYLSGGETALPSRDRPRLVVG